MLRLILLFFLIALAFSGLWRMLGRARRRGAGGNAVAARMVRCAHCDLYLPLQDALQRGGDYYCGEEHLALGPRPPQR
jgi:uncharacterized protein